MVMESGKGEKYHASVENDLLKKIKRDLIVNRTDLPLAKLDLVNILHFSSLQQKRNLMQSMNLAMLYRKWIKNKKLKPARVPAPICVSLHPDRLEKEPDFFNVKIGFKNWYKMEIKNVGYYVIRKKIKEDYQTISAHV